MQHLILNMPQHVGSVLISDIFSHYFQEMTTATWQTVLTWPPCPSSLGAPLFHRTPFFSIIILSPHENLFPPETTKNGGVCRYLAGKSLVRVEKPSQEPSTFVHSQRKVRSLMASDLYPQEKDWNLQQMLLWEDELALQVKKSKSSRHSHMWFIVTINDSVREITEITKCVCVCVSVGQWSREWSRHKVRQSVSLG